MSFDIRYSEHFRKSAKQLAKKYPSLKSDLGALGANLAENPEMGTPLGNNLYKIRMAITSKGRGEIRRRQSNYLCCVQSGTSAFGRNL